MFKEERRHAIINLLIKDNSVSVSKLSGLYKVSQETIRSDLRFFQKSGMLQRCYGGGILNRDALSKLITENKIDISSTIATPIHQDAKLRRESTKKAGKVCVLGSFNIDVSATVPWFPQSGESILDSILAVKEPTRRWRQTMPVLRHILFLKWARISSAHLR